MDVLPERLTGAGGRCKRPVFNRRLGTTRAKAIVPLPAPQQESRRSARRVRVQAKRLSYVQRFTRKVLHRGADLLSAPRIVSAQPTAHALQARINDTLLACPAQHLAHLPSASSEKRREHVDSAITHIRS
eukprot:5568122-Pleurochrysis_carterae.AAC.1